MTGNGEPPHAPWHLAGECILGWTRVPRALRALVPAGVRAMPGPGALVGVRYHDSPVGPYLELALGVPARIGVRPGLCIVFQVVSSPDARIAYRRNWGLPAVVGALSWDVDGTERMVRCEEPGIEMRGAPLGPAVPAWVPLRSVQRRADGPVVLPRRFLSLVRLARTSVAIGDGADIVVPGLSALAGRHAGAVLSGVRIVAEPARHPAGLWSSLRAPLGAVEPAMAGAGGGGGGRGRVRGRGSAGRAAASASASATSATSSVGQKWSPKVTTHAVPTTKTDHSMRPTTVALRTGA